MNLFIIPSWYPSKKYPISGIFTKEQAEAIADLCQDFRVVVSTWGHGDSEISIRHPWQSLMAIYWRAKQATNQLRKNNGVWEVFNPALSWSEKMPFGGIRRLIDVNRRNLQLAMDRFGTISIIHAHVSYPGGYVASILSKEFGIPYVLTEHMSPFPFPSLMHDNKPIPQILSAFSNAKISVAVSPSLARRIVSFGCPEPRVIPNMVDERKFSLATQNARKFIFLTLCGLTDQKGIDHLLEAIALWNPPSDSFEFWIGGDGPMRSIYQTMSVKLGISDRVKWLGSVNHIAAPQLFQQCHIYVMPSRHETFGVVYAEAIACGKPIIATRCGGPEFIINERNGKLVGIGDIIGLSNAMKKMASNWDQYSPSLIREDFEGRFSRGVVVSQLRLMYLAALES